MGKSKDVKKNVLPHSQAKLDLYKSYLDLYLPILGNTPYVSAINIFDLYCGTGIYDDGKKGSPLIAAECISNYEGKWKVSKPIRLYVNDFDSGKVSTVKEYIEQVQFNNCSVQAFNLDANEMFNLVGNIITQAARTERSLVFIDPYGYSQIRKASIYRLLQTGKSEIILFLPVAYMRRFSQGALTDLDNKAYENLRGFITDFLPNESPIRQGRWIDVFEYIEELKKAFAFNNRFYTASYYLERGPGNYFSLFFIGSHIYGLEKFIEAKWSNSTLGTGFNQSDHQPTLWGNGQAEMDRSIALGKLELHFRQLMKTRMSVSNKELYEFTLYHQFTPSAMTKLVAEWHRNKKLVVYTVKGDIIEKPRSFGISYSKFKEPEATCIFKLR